MARENQRKKCREYIWDILESSECVDCGEKNPLLLEFDHIDPATKREKVSQLVNRGQYTALVEEVAKCETRCANCHRLSSAMDHRYYKDYIDWENNAVVDLYMSSYRGVRSSDKG